MDTCVTLYVIKDGLVRGKIPKHYEALVPFLMSELDAYVDDSSIESITLYHRYNEKYHIDKSPTRIMSYTARAVEQDPEWFRKELAKDLIKEAKKLGFRFLREDNI